MVNDVEGLRDCELTRRMTDFIEGIPGALELCIGGDCGCAEWPASQDAIITDGVAVAAALGFEVTSKDDGWMAVQSIVGFDFDDLPARIEYVARRCEGDVGPVVEIQYERHRCRFK